MEEIPLDGPVTNAGRVFRVWDVVSAARYCVPFTHPSRRDPSVRFDEDEIHRRLLVLLDAYGLSRADREAFPEVLDQRRQVGEDFILGRRGVHRLGPGRGKGARPAAERNGVAGPASRL